MFLLKESAIGLPDLEATFDEIAEAFVFFDRNKDGYVSKKEMIWAINEASPSGRQGHRIGVQRFGLSLHEITVPIYLYSYVSLLIWD